MHYLFLIPGILLAITLHEFAHGWASWKLGDPTPKQTGRLTLNPLRHLDPFGVICMMIFHMGWAKPVEINPYYYKNKKAGIALVSLAGPAVNILSGAVGIFILIWLEISTQTGRMEVTVLLQNIYRMLYYFSILSINLAVFNLIPIPPLDGSKILSAFLPDHALQVFIRYERYFTIILVVALYMGLLDGAMDAAYNIIYDGILKLAELVFRPMLITTI